ncbi:CAP domain-containing protein [Priestia megaterium]|uniref:CAP domain-containing protein n=1 Tax=Priestia megaterium TaxID=1404 RepID=UPI00203CA227|nr:CAP domain-containing protein [Priestia megaterium]MCM3155566.1 CAP domain-containing protein [Priestia megaterium]
MKKQLVAGLVALGVIGASTSAFADYDYTVKSGDTFWKIADKTHTGIDEIISANPQVKNINMIYPNQKLTIPTLDQASQSYEQQVISLVNKERQKAGLKPLKENWELSRVARFKSQDMHDKGYFDHNSPTYGSPFKMIKDFGISYNYAGENIAYGQRTPEEVMKAWMNSSGHRANILSPNFTQIGVGYVKDGNYWTQQFISQ